MLRPVAITWTFVISPTISNMGHRSLRWPRLCRTGPTKSADSHAIGSARSHHTSGAQHNFDFPRTTSRVGLGDVISSFEVGILAENFFARSSNLKERQAYLAYDEQDLEHDRRDLGSR
jgi:hypothetical protein